MLRTVLISLVAMVLLAATAMPATARMAGGAVRLEARLSGATAMKGKSVYEERPSGSLVEQRLKVSIQHAVPGTIYEVRVEGVLVGTVQANALGRAERNFRAVRAPGATSPVPWIEPGDTVTVGPTSGTYQPN